VNGHDTVQSPAQNHTVAAAAKLLTGAQGEFGHVPGGSAITVYQDGRNLLSFLHEEQTPVDFARVDVRVIDAYGEEVQPFYKPMSLTLEVTSIMQSQLYEQQRNRMFQMGER
jgi:predicted house-cleaning NTP pyrophosphatase (Maf/HAM1 superfamily)